MRVILRIGGSVVASPINTDLINRYTELMKDLKRQGHELVVVVGGGKLAREMIGIARDIGVDELAQDEVAISVSRIFAQLFLKKLGKIGCGTVPLTLENAAKSLSKRKIVVMGGLKPGMTTDTVAALAAEKMKGALLVKATNQEGVFDKDPKVYPDAVKLDHLKFGDLSKVFSENKHKAGIHQIIDPEAVKILKRCKVKVAIVNGFKVENVMLAVKGKRIGTLID